MLDRLPDDQADRLQFAFEEAGYRLPVTIRFTDGSKKGPGGWYDNTEGFTARAV